MEMDQINLGNELIVGKDLYKENMKEITQENSSEFKFALAMIICNNVRMEI